MCRLQAVKRLKIMRQKTRGPFIFSPDEETNAAAKLGLNRTTITSKMKRLGLTRPLE